MEAIFVILFVLVSTGFVYGVMFYPEITASTRKSLAQRARAKELGSKIPLSAPSNKLFDEYKELAVEDRPYSDIISILRGLDERYSDDPALKEHFQYRYSSKPLITFHAGSGRNRCDHAYKNRLEWNRCPFPEYPELHAMIEKVKESAAAKNKAILKAKTEHVVDEFDRLKQDLEAAVQNNELYTKEFNKLS